MAIDPNILQLLTQLQGGGTPSPAISPSSGLKEPSLSGLALGEQGMGFGGGGSILGGGGAGIGGGTEGPGLDILSLLNQSMPAPAGGGIQPSLGQVPFQFPTQLPTFGAGGQLTQGSQIGQSGMGGGGLLGALSALLKAGTPITKILKQLLTPTGVMGTIPPDVATGTNIATGGLGGFGTQLGGLLGQTVPSDVAAGADIATGGIGATGALSAVSGTNLLGAGGVFGEAAASAAPTGAGSLGALLPTLGADATSTLGGFAGALSPVTGILSLLSLADLFGAPKLGFGNIFFGQKANDLTAAQTEAVLKQVGALAKASGPAEQLFFQKNLDTKLLENLGLMENQAAGLNLSAGGSPTTPVTLPAPFAQQLLDIIKSPKGVLSPANVTAFGQIASPGDYLKFLTAINQQRRLRTYAGLPTLAAPPPSIENALLPTASTNPLLLAAIQNITPPPYDPLAGVSA